MDNLDKDLAEMNRLGYGVSYGRYKLDYPNTKVVPTKPAEKKPRQCAPPKKYRQTCAICGKAFVTTVSYKMYCSDLCYRNAAQRRYREKKLEKKPKLIGKCAICGANFVQVRATHKYCSDDCKTKANREKQREWRARLKEVR